MVDNPSLMSLSSSIVLYLCMDGKAHNMNNRHGLNQTFGLVLFGCGRNT